MLFQRSVDTLIVWLEQRNCASKFLTLNGKLIHKYLLGLKLFICITTWRIINLLTPVLQFTLNMSLFCILYKHTNIKDNKV